MTALRTDDKYRSLTLRTTLQKKQHSRVTIAIKLLLHDYFFQKIYN